MRPICLVTWSAVLDVCMWGGSSYYGSVVPCGILLLSHKWQIKQLNFCNKGHTIITTFKMRVHVDYSQTNTLSIQLSKDCFWLHFNIPGSNSGSIFVFVVMILTTSVMRSRMYNVVLRLDSLCLHVHCHVIWSCPLSDKTLPASLLCEKHHHNK